jgi:hypothetical protein
LRGCQSRDHQGHEQCFRSHHGRNLIREKFHADDFRHSGISKAHHQLDLGQLDRRRQAGQQARRGGGSGPETSGSLLGWLASSAIATRASGGP